MKATTKMWIGLAALVVLSPLGLILPAKLGAGSAWGEWSGEEIRKLVGYLPSGMARLADLWNAPMADYALKGQESAPLGVLSLSYILSGVVGVGMVTLVAVLIGKVLARRERSDAS
jgi:hypothetical protein